MSYYIGDTEQSVTNTFSENVEETSDNHLISSNDNFQRMLCYRLRARVI